MRHHCLDCGAEFPSGFHPFCDRCAGMVDVDYDLKNVTLRDSKNPFVRFIDLLPVERLQDRLPDVAYTPLVHAGRLGRKLGMSSLYIKNETALPTRTTKDRMAAISLAYLRERGVRSFTASSTGNSSTSFAYGMRAHPDMHLFLFTAERFVPRVQHADHYQVTHIGMRDATFVEAARYADVYARKHGLTSESGFFNPGRREGLKLAFLEACDQLEQPIDWYVQAVSSAMGVYGAYKGARELHALNHIPKLPRLLCVQQESCAPMVHAFAEGSETIQPKHVVARPTGIAAQDRIADAILRGDPTRAYPRIRRIVLESRGDLTSVSEAEIRAARKSVEEHEGISPCFSASTAVAGLIKSVAAGAVDRNATIVINLTGADRPDAQTSPNVHWTERTADGWNAAPPASLMPNKAALAD